MDYPKPWLRYIEASKVSDKTLVFSHLKVRNSAGDRLGAVDGLVVDSESGRPYYVVVDAGGWFKSRHFLVPIGEIHLDADKDAFVVPLAKDQIARFPGFDTDEFGKLTENDVKRINDETSAVYEPHAEYAADEPYDAAWARTSYRLPEWWTAEGGERKASDVLGIEAERQHVNVGEGTTDEAKRRV